MDSFEINKIAGATLGSLLFVMVVGFVSDAIFSVPKPAQPGWDIAAAAPATGSGPAKAAAAVEPIAVRLVKADGGVGQTVFRQCVACHTSDKGGPNRTGPNLWGVVGGPKAHTGNFGYSQAMRDRAAKGETWDFEALDQFLANPKGYLPGTAMAFAGLKNPDQRASLVAYLRSLADTPVPLPQ